MTSPWRPEASSLWRQNCLPCFHHPVDYASGTQGLGLAKIFLFSAWIADGCPAYLLLLLPFYFIHSHYLPGSSPSSLPSSIVGCCPTSSIPTTYWDHIHHPYRHPSSSPSSSSIPSSSGTPIFLFYVIGYFSSSKLFFFSSSNCAELKYVIFCIFVFLCFCAMSMYVQLTQCPVSHALICIFG